MWTFNKKKHYVPFVSEGGDLFDWREQSQSTLMVDGRSLAFPDF
jgi:hypothetical protein